MNTPAQCGVIKPPKADIYSEAPQSARSRLPGTPPARPRPPRSSRSRQWSSTLPRRCGNRLTGSATRRSSNAAPPTGPAASTRPRWPPSTPCERSRGAGLHSTPRSLAMTANSTGSPHWPRLACATASASAPTPPPNCSSSSATTPNGSTQRPRSRNSAAPARSPPRPGRLTAIASRGGHRQANAALYRVVIVPMRFHQRTIDYVARRSAEGLTKKDIIRCLKRFVGREA